MQIFRLELRINLTLGYFHMYFCLYLCVSYVQLNAEFKYMWCRLYIQQLRYLFYILCKYNETYKIQTNEKNNEKEGEEKQKIHCKVSFDNENKSIVRFGTM